MDTRTIDDDFAEVEKLAAASLAYHEQALKYVLEKKRILEQELAEQKAEKAKSGCFFWRKNKIAAAPQGATERTSILSPVK